MVTLGKISHTVSTPRHNVVEANDAAAQEDMANSAVFAELARRRAVQSSSAAPPIVPVLSEPARRRAEFRQRSASRLRSNDVADVAVAPSRPQLQATAASGACASRIGRGLLPHGRKTFGIPPPARTFSQAKRMGLAPWYCSRNKAKRSNNRKYRSWRSNTCRRLFRLYKSRCDHDVVEA